MFITHETCDTPQPKRGTRSTHGRSTRLFKSHNGNAMLITAIINLLRCFKASQGDFYMARYFGTDGIRGVAGIDLTAEFCFRLGEAVKKKRQLPYNFKFIYIYPIITSPSSDAHAASVLQDSPAYPRSTLKIACRPTDAPNVYDASTRVRNNHPDCT